MVVVLLERLSLRNYYVVYMLISVISFGVYGDIIYRMADRVIGIPHDSHTVLISNEGDT